MSEHIVAVFDTEKAADAAARDLENAGVSASGIRRFRPDTMRAATDTSLDRTMESTSSTSGGFWAWLLGDEPSTETTRPSIRGMKKCMSAHTPGKRSLV